MRISREAVNILAERLNFLRDLAQNDEEVKYALGYKSTKLELALGLTELGISDPPGHEYFAVLRMIQNSPECFIHPGDAGIIARAVIRFCLLQTALIEAGISLLPEAYARKDDLREYEQAAKEWLDAREAELMEQEESDEA